MIRVLFERLQESGNLRSFFYLGEFALFVIFAGLVWLLRPQSPESNFRVREADLPRKKNKPHTEPDRLANARIQKQETLKLEGIRIDGECYEILGISPSATFTEIQHAYRNLMKNYHPDKVGLQGSREWKDAQKIAESINRAKVEMLNRIKNK